MIRAYHFVGDRLRDGRPVPPDGEWLVHDGTAVICQSGLHASRHPAAYAAACPAAYDAERRAQCAIIRDEIPLPVVKAALNRRIRRE